MSDSELAWFPWVTYAVDDVAEELLPIKGPPCSTCEFWAPMRKWAKIGKRLKFDGIVCCHADEMWDDFQLPAPEDGRIEHVAERKTHDGKRMAGRA